MAGETIVTIIGTLTAAPELRFTPSGAAVATFTVASNSRFYDKTTSAWKDGDALFMRCTAWRQLAENIAESLTKGTRIIVNGQLRQETFETKQGDKRTVMKLLVEEVGPSLKWAVAKIAKATRSDGNGSTPADDPWASAPASNQAGNFSEEPPF